MAEKTDIVEEVVPCLRLRGGGGEIHAEKFSSSSFRSSAEKYSCNKSVCGRAPFCFRPAKLHPDAVYFQYWYMSPQRLRISCAAEDMKKANMLNSTSDMEVVRS